MSRWIRIMPAFLVLLTGCQQQDRELLLRFGKRAVGKVQALTEESSSKLLGKQTSAAAQELTIEGKVQSRLNWDKSLADACIQVSGDAGVIALHGSVKDLQQRRRAVELAESTVGTNQVVDELASPPLEP